MFNAKKILEGINNVKYKLEGCFAWPNPMNGEGWRARDQGGKIFFFFWGGVMF